MSSKQINEKLQYWFEYAENYKSRWLVINLRAQDQHAGIAYTETPESPAAMPANARRGNAVFFDSISVSEALSFKSLLEDASGESLSANKASLGVDIDDEALTAKLKGNGFKIGGVNHNDYMITMTLFLNPTRDEYLDMFKNGKPKQGGVEEQFMEYWRENYGELTEEQFHQKVEELKAKNKDIEIALKERAEAESRKA